MRSFDADRINFLVNHPTIRPHAGGDGVSYLDFGPLLTEENHFLSGEHGGVFFHWCAPDVYEVHIFILPEGRGRWAYDFAQAGLDYARSIGAIQLWARVTTRQMRLFTLATGFVRRGERSFSCQGHIDSYSIFDWRSTCHQQQR